MKIFCEGDKSKAVCAACSAVQPTTFVRKDVPFSTGEGLVKDILVGVCDLCQRVVSIPAQSTPAISSARKLSELSAGPREEDLPSV
jgi:hypothetical protein